ncbi:MAG: 50S ribosomal protein L21 [Myxococcota bacterium]|jgi:large subunit ribosomal protein L21|nr:50S ribosomal protein L21 [Myxococcota bacterium]
MYAVIRTGSKQYRVGLNDVLRIERIPVEPGTELDFEVLALGEGAGLRVGQPILAGAKVTGKVVSQGRDRKVIVYKMRHRKNYHRKKGHRQYYTEVLITNIAS